jgi:hypothetical protein
MIRSESRMISDKVTSLIKRLAAIMIVVVIIAVTAGHFVRQSRLDAPVALTASAGPAFAVQIWKPVMSGRPIWDSPAAMFGLSDREMRFDQTTPGARIGRISGHHLELDADGWQVIVKTNDDGRIAGGTTAMFPLDPANIKRGARCSVEERATGGYLRTAPHSGTNEIDGEFRVDFTDCIYVNTGRGSGWLSLVVRGSFARLTSR